MTAERLQGLENTRQQNPRYSTAHSAVIRSLKIVLPLSALAMVGVLLLWPRLSSIQTVPLSESDVAALQQAQKENALLDPVFSTEDDKGRPMVITATEAKQDRDTPDMIDLTTPHATLKDNGTTMTIDAERGQYDQSQKIMYLENNVTLRDSDNNILETQSLTADIAKGAAQSHSAATLTTPDGTIEGRTIRIENNGERTIFQGPAKAVLNAGETE